MKYFEPILILLFIALICVFWVSRDKPSTDNYKRYQDSLNNQIAIIRTQFDSLSKIERTLITKKTTINHYYDSTKTIIINLPDSANFDLLRSNLARFDYLSKPSPSQGN